MAYFELSYDVEDPDAKQRAKEISEGLMAESITTTRYLRAILMNMSLDEATPLKDVQAAVMENFDTSLATVNRYRRMLANDWGLLRTFKKDRHWFMQLTDEGAEFCHWLLSDVATGQRWGVKQRVKVSEEERKRLEEAFIQGETGSGGLVEIKDEIVKWDLPEDGLVLDQRIPRSVWAKLMSRVKKNGFLTVFVPEGYEVCLVKVEDSTGKRKAARILRWSDFPRVDRQLISDELADGKGVDEAFKASKESEGGSGDDE